MSSGALLPSTPAAPRLWIDVAPYGATLFGRDGRYPADVAGIVALHRQAQRLIGSDATFISMGDIVDAVVREAPAAGALALLADDHAARTMLDVLSACARLPDLSPALVLVVPSPRAWIERAAGGRPVAPTLDDLDDVAVGLAEALRGLAAVPLAGLLIGDGRLAPVTPEEHAVLSPILNLARHYRWTVGAHLAPADAPAIDDLDFVVDAVSEAVDIVQRGRERPVLAGGLPAGWWLDADRAPPTGAGPWFGTIPPTAEPELVLAKLRALRARG